MKTKPILCCLLTMAAFLSPTASAHAQKNSQKIAELQQQVQFLEQEVSQLTQRVTILESHNNIVPPHGAIYVCTVNAFGNVYQGKSQNHAKVTLKAMEKCSKANNQMFCTKDNVSCETIK